MPHESRPNVAPTLWPDADALAPFAPPRAVAARSQTGETEGPHPWVDSYSSPASAIDTSTEEESLPDDEAWVGTAADEIGEYDETAEDWESDREGDWEEFSSEVTSADGREFASFEGNESFETQTFPSGHSGACRCPNCVAETEMYDGDISESESDPEREAQSDPEFGGLENETSYAPALLGHESWSEMLLPDGVFEDGFEDEEEETEDELTASTALQPGLSPLARRSRLHPGKGIRKSPWDKQVYGLVVHTTGGTLPGKAQKAGQPHDEYAVGYYLGSGGTHYVNGWGGIDGQQLHQVMNERHVAWGVGKSKDQPAKDQWKSNDAGRFERDLPPTVVRLWRARWPGFKDSLSLLPVRNSANLTYVHMECVPCVYYRNGSGGLITDPTAAPLRPGLRFTRAQHETVARLAWDMAERHRWPRGEAWWRTPRLVGHEDITPLSRHDKNGGWDPGGLRDAPYFDWAYVYASLEKLRGAPSSAQTVSSTGAVTSVVSSVGSVLGTLAERFRQLIRTGQEILAITEAARSGHTDVNVLANLVFFARHPELKGRKLRPEERALAQEWLRIRDTVVRPTLAKLQPVSPGRPQADAPSTSRSNRSGQATGTTRAGGGAGVRDEVVARIKGYTSIVEAAARKYGMEPSLIYGVIAAESGGQKNLVAKSGYTGLMQSDKLASHKDPSVSVDAGTKKLRDFRAIMSRVMTDRGRRYESLPEGEQLKLLALAYNAGPVTVAKALQYAAEAGRPESWSDPEHYQRALLFTGAYSFKQAARNCLPGLGASEVESRMLEARRTWNQYSAKIRLRQGSKKATWRDLSDPPAWSTISPTLPALVVCAIGFKHRNSRGYVEKILAYRDRFRAR